MSNPINLAAIIADGQRLCREATPGPLRAAGGYLTTRNPDGRSFGLSIYHVDECGQPDYGQPFQAIPFARPGDARLLAFAWNNLPLLLRLARAVREWQEADAEVTVRGNDSQACRCDDNDHCEPCAALVRAHDRFEAAEAVLRSFAASGEETKE